MRRARPSGRRPYVGTWIAGPIRGIRSITRAEPPLCRLLPPHSRDTCIPLRREDPVGDPPLAMASLDAIDVATAIHVKELIAVDVASGDGDDVGLDVGNVPGLEDD